MLPFLLPETYDVRVVNNETWCQASVLLNISRQKKANESSTRTCKTTLFKSSLGPKQSEEDQKNRKQGKGKTISGFKVVFEVHHITNNFVIVFSYWDIML